MDEPRNEPRLFGQWVKQRRKALDLTQHVLAQQVGCALSTLQKIETEARRPSSQLAELLAVHLELTADERPAFVQLARRRAAPVPPLPPLALPTGPPVDNLPQPLTSLVGRQQEVATLCARLWEEPVRLLTLTGPPGIGKTRLALQVADEVHTHFADGVCWVALAPVAQERFVPAAIARALGIDDRGGSPLMEQIKAQLRRRSLLLLLDNCEHLLSAAPFLIELLETAPQLKVLATSRALLQVYGEHEFVVPSLAVPDLKPLPSPDQLRHCAAVELFVQRARAVQHDFRLSAGNAAVVAELCVRLDGVPLALELAAARTKQFTPQALLARLRVGLTPRLELLAGARQLPARQHSLRSAIAWSYALLNPTERGVLRTLGVFAGGATLEAVGYVVQALGVGHEANEDDASPPTYHPSSRPQRHTLAGVLAELVSQSLVSQQDTDGTARFALLEMIREFALEQLDLHGEREAAQRAHVRWCLALAERFARAIEPRQVEGVVKAEQADEVEKKEVLLGALERELDNLRAGLLWVDAHDLALTLRLTSALVNFWSVRRHLGEGRVWLEHLVPRLKPIVAQLSPAQQAQYTELHFMWAFFSWQQGDYTLAQVRLAESVTLAQALGDGRNEGCALQFLALTYYDLGDVATAYAPAVASVARLRQAGELWDLAIALISLSAITAACGDDATAQTLYAEGAALFRRLGDAWGETFALLRLSEMHFDQGNDAEARRCLEEVLPIFRAEDQLWFVAQILLYMGKVHWRQGDLAHAATLWEESVTLAREVGAKGYLSGALLLLGWAAQARGEAEQAYAFWRESAAVYQAMGHKLGAAYVLSALATVSQTPAQAARRLGAAAGVLERVRLPMDAIERAQYERAVAVVRTQLAETTFAGAWAEGQATPLEAALAEALAAVP